MEHWFEFYRDIVDYLKFLETEKKCGMPFFRGQRESNWELIPSIARKENSFFRLHQHITYFDYKVQAGELLGNVRSEWDYAFSMQHHGLPTRLLDWSTNFASALFFAVKSASESAAIYILDPFNLNKLALKREELLSPEDLDGNYFELFISESKQTSWDVCAISPIHHHKRVFAQKCVFTLHNELDSSIDKLYPSSFKKIVLNNNQIEGAKAFLELAGVNEYSLFPDLDGLARHLKQDMKA
jgi:hypothetical protein